MAATQEQYEPLAMVVTVGNAEQPFIQLMTGLTNLIDMYHNDFGMGCTDEEILLALQTVRERKSIQMKQKEATPNE